METGHCAFCGASFIPFNNRKAQRFCSSSCCYKAKAARRQHPVRECEWCGHLYPVTNRGKSGAARKYCSSTCLGHSRRPTSSPVPWAQCLVCERWFVTHGSKTCSLECGEMRAKRAWRYQGAVTRGQPCRVNCRGCGIEMEYLYTSGIRRWCERCKAQRKLEAKRLSRRGSQSYRAKARRLGVSYEPVNVQRVFARDGWRCGLCGKKVNRKFRYPHPMSASLDHIVPMNATDLGEHSYRNTQCAHLRCNVLKGRRGSSQLRLVG